MCSDGALGMHRCIHLLRPLTNPSLSVYKPVLGTGDIEVTKAQFFLDAQGKHVETHRHVAVLWVLGWIRWARDAQAGLAAAGLHVALWAH